MILQNSDGRGGGPGSGCASFGDSSIRLFCAGGTNSFADCNGSGEGVGSICWCGFHRNDFRTILQI